MFSKLQSVRKWTNEVISIDELAQIIRNNPQSELIQKIRKVQYKSKEYNQLKLQCTCVTPHGIFNSLTNDGLVKFSNYLYYDIDGIDTENELNDTINRLCEKFPISLLQKSVGGQGIHFLIKIDDTILEPKDTFLFNKVYSYVREMLLNVGFNIDLSANGLARKMIISLDKDCLLNNDVCLSIDKEIFNDYRQIKGDIRCNIKKVESITLNDTFFELIPIKELLQQIQIKTQYTKEIEGDYVIEEMNHYMILLPEKIADGIKHTLYTRIINALYYINSNITRQQVLSYLYYVNNRALPPMNSKYLYNFVTRLCDYIEKTGEIRIKTRIKKIHFNEKSKLTKKQKQSMAAKINGQLRTNKTRETIQKAKYELGIRNMKITQKSVAELTGLSIRTVKRNWTKEKKEINITIPEITEKEFFDKKETEIIRYKGFKDVEIDKITPEDKKLFISKIIELKDIGLLPSETLLVEMNIFTKEKTWYLYKKWLEKYGTLQ